MLMLWSSSSAKLINALTPAPLEDVSVWLEEPQKYVVHDKFSF